MVERGLHMNKTIKLFFASLIVFVGFGLSGCDVIEQSQVTSISVDSSTIQNLEMGDFNISDIKIVLHKADGTTQSIPLTTAMLSETDIQKMSIAGNHTITIKYGTHETTIEVTIQGTELELRLSTVYLLGVTSNQITGTYDEWLASITGPAGIGIKEATINSAGHLIITLTNDETIDAGAVIGPSGQNGNQIELQATSTHIQWRLEGDTEWVDLIELETLEGTSGTDGENGLGIKTVTINILGELIITFDDDTELNVGVVVGTNGTDGINGVDGKDGANGISITNASINQNGQLIITLSNEQTINAGSIIGPKGDDGVDGKEVMLRVSEGFIQWKYDADLEWDNLISLTVLTGPMGPNGTDGTNGIDGRELEVNAVNHVLYYRYVGSETWIPLFDLTDYLPTTTMVTITFDLDEGELPEPHESSINIVYGTSMVLPIPTKEGYVFKGWYTGTTINDGQFFNYIPITQSMTLYALWEESNPIVGDLEVFFYVDGVLYHKYEQVVNGTSIVGPSEPTKSGFLFLGWNTSIEAIAGLSFPQTITSNVSYHAIWKPDQVTTEDNHFYLVKEAETSTNVTIKVYLGGNPNIAGYDLRIFYDEAKVIPSTVVNGVSNVWNIDILGEVRFNWADVMSPIQNEQLLMTITFDKLASAGTNLQLDLVVIEATEVDEEFNLYIATTSTAGLAFVLSE